MNVRAACNWDSLPKRPVVGAFTATATAHVREALSGPCWLENSTGHLYLPVLLADGLVFRNVAPAG